MEHSPISLVFFSKRRRTLDQFYLRLTWSRMRGIIRKTGFILGVICWPILLCIKTSESVLCHGYETRASFDIPIVRQWFEQVLFGLLYGRPPHMYYDYGLFEKDRSLHVRDYISAQEFRGFVEAAADPTLYTLFGDKFLFENLCVQAGIPCVRSLLVINKGETKKTTGEEGGTLPPEDLFVKPTDGDSGKDCMLYRWDGSGYKCLDGSFVSASGLFERLLSLSSSKKLLVQPKICNHYYFERFGITSLCTIRLISAIGKSNDIELLWSGLKIPRANMDIDNLGAGGIGCPVDLSSGHLLGVGYVKGSSVPFYAHPDAKFPFQGMKIPLWKDVLDLVINAHRRFTGLAFVGWDIAITQEGSLLVEGNEFPGLWFMQQAYGPLLKDERFKSICMDIGNNFHYHKSSHK